MGGWPAFLDPNSQPFLIIHEQDTKEIMSVCISETNSAKFHDQFSSQNNLKAKYQDKNG